MMDFRDFNSLLEEGGVPNYMQSAGRLGVVRKILG